MSDKAMEELWKVLADLGTVRYSRDHGEPDPSPAFAYEIAFTPKQWGEFHARLLPLLEAGQAYYKEPPGIDQKYHDAYVTALQAAKGS